MKKLRHGADNDIDRAFLAKQHHPRIHADNEIRPKRDQHNKQICIAFFRMRARNKISEWIRHANDQRGCVECQRQGSSKDLHVQRIKTRSLTIGTIRAIAKQPDVIIQRECIDHVPVGTALPKTDDKFFSLNCDSVESLIKIRLNENNNYFQISDLDFSCCIEFGIDN